MPHATMDRRLHQAGGGPGGTGQHIYSTLPSSRSPAMYPDSYGSVNNLSGGGNGGVHSMHSPGGFYASSSSSPDMTAQSNYGTLPSQQRVPSSPLPSYHDVVQSSTLPRQYRAQQYAGNHRIPPNGTQQDFSTHTLPADTKDPVPLRQLPPPSLSRHTVKVLQVPILVVGGEDNGGREVGISTPSPSPSPSPSSTISDTSAVQPARPVTAGQSHTLPKNFAHATPGTHLPNNNIQRFTTTSGPDSQGSPSGGIYHGQAYTGTSGMAHTLPHYRSGAIPTHMQRPSPSSSPVPTVSSIPGNLQHPARGSPSPSPSPVPDNRSSYPSQPSPTQQSSHSQYPQNNQPMTGRSQPSVSQPESIPPAVTTGSQALFPTPMGSLASLGTQEENTKSSMTPPVMDISNKMRSIQEEMQRMQRQMEDQFRSMQVAPPPPPPAGFPTFPPMMAPSFAGLPQAASMDLPSGSSSGAPSLIESDFGSMMSGDMGMGQPIVADTIDGNNKSGKKQLKLNLDMHEFAPDEVKVRTDKNKLEVTAHHEEKDPNRITCRVFKQQYHLPENVRMAKIQYDMTPTGELKVEGTVKPRHRVKWAEDTLTK